MSPYQGYAYGYPHKLAYRPLDPALSLKEVWRDEPRDSLFLYVHIPFCEMRCGFCNLFTTANPAEGMVSAYLDALDRQLDLTQRAFEATGSDKPKFARAALGGGTPTFLSPGELERLYAMLERTWGSLSNTPWSVEMSPATVTAEKLQFLLSRGMRRASIGVQSFLSSETRSLGRAQDPSELHQALSLMRNSGVRALNIDLIYGAEGQTPATWLQSLNRAMEYAPEELYLYPLYVRPLTGLGKRAGDSVEVLDPRPGLYQIACEFLLARGYRQISMRLFRAGHYPDASGPEYCCQEDGMLGLGAGARSYTRSTHYSTEYAVGRPDVQSILRHYIEEYSGGSASNIVADPGAVTYGIVLNDHEQQRRYVIKSLLRSDGLNMAQYASRFGAPALGHFPQLAELEELQLALRERDYLRLTSRGLGLSDAIGPWLYSYSIRKLMESYELS
ncbi:MAG: STM4012 family radical SAM protein [Candidatus Methylacidiphilales bacterium]